MASERLSRALMSVGDDLGRFAEVAYSREQAEADRLHQESLVRLREKMAKSRQQAEFKFRSEESEADRAAREAAAVEDRDFASAENRKDREFRTSESAKDRALTQDQLADADLRSIREQAAERMSRIDKRVTEISDQVWELKADVGVVDPELLAQKEAELKNLSALRKETRRWEIQALHAAGDPMYANLGPKQLQAAVNRTLADLDGSSAGAPAAGGKGPQTHDGQSAVQNPDGSISTEVSITVQDDRLNGGRPTNIPSLWGGKIVSDQDAIRLSIESGNQYPAFNSIEEAVSAAKARSAEKGGNADAINADEIIQRPPGRRRNRGGRQLMEPTPAPRAQSNVAFPIGPYSTAGPADAQGKFFENLFKSFSADAAEDRRRLMGEPQLVRSGKGSM